MSCGKITCKVYAIATLRSFSWPKGIRVNKKGMSTITGRHAENA